LKFLADENFDNDILRALRLRRSDIDVLRVQDIDDIYGADDPIVLEWAAQQTRILLTHDVQTMTKYAYNRVREQKYMPGVFEVKRGISINVIVDDLVLIIDYGELSEWENKVTYIPLQ